MLTIWMKYYSVVQIVEIVPDSWLNIVLKRLLDLQKPLQYKKMFNMFSINFSYIGKLLLVFHHVQNHTYLKLLSWGCVQNRRLLLILRMFGTSLRR